MKRLDKYAVNYTLKEEVFTGYHQQLFMKKKPAKEWIKANEGKLYWHQLVHLYPKSRQPRPIITFETLSENYDKYTGILQTYYETGMECMGLVFYRDDVPKGSLNPKFDPTQPESKSNFKYYKSYEGIIMLGNGMVLLLPGEQKVGLLKDIDFAKQDGYRLSFYPRGFSKKEWVGLFINEDVKATLWVRKSVKK